MASDKTVYTIDRIARELGVSKATVSRALSGKGKLSEQTRQRVLDFAREHHYSPNAVAQSLARSRTCNLGIMLPGNGAIQDGAFFSACLQGICKTAAASGYDVIVTMDDESPLEHLLRLIDNRKVDGVIAMRSLTSSPVAELLRQKQVPYVLIGPLEDPASICVDNDNAGACRELVTRLIDRGIRKMALLGGDEGYCVTHSRSRGFLAACEAAGLTECPIYPGLSDSSRIAAAIDDILRQNITCVLCMDDAICQMALTVLRQRNIRIPDDLRIASFYDSVLLENHIPPVTAIRFDAAELGQMACRELLLELESGTGSSRVMTGHRIELRPSTGEE